MPGIPDTQSTNLIHNPQSTLNMQTKADGGSCASSWRRTWRPTPWLARHLLFILHNHLRFSTSCQVQAPTFHFPQSSGSNLTFSFSAIIWHFQCLGNLLIEIILLSKIKLSIYKYLNFLTDFIGRQPRWVHAPDHQVHDCDCDHH